MAAMHKLARVDNLAWSLCLRKLYGVYDVTGPSSGDYEWGYSIKVGFPLYNYSISKQTLMIVLERKSEGHQIIGDPLTSLDTKIKS